MTARNLSRDLAKVRHENYLTKIVAECCTLIGQIVVCIVAFSIQLNEIYANNFNAA